MQGKPRAMHKRNRVDKKMGTTAQLASTSHFSSTMCFFGGSLRMSDVETRNRSSQLGPDGRGVGQIIRGACFRRCTVSYDVLCLMVKNDRLGYK